MTRTIKVEYVQAEDPSIMEKKYNSAFHNDMLQTNNSEYDGAPTWYNEDVGNLMKEKPWGFVPIHTSELEQLLSLSLMANYRTLKNTFTDNEAVQAVAARLDECIRQEGKADTRIFARINECSMKRSRGGIFSFTNSLDIVRAVVEDPRVYGWLTNCQIPTTTIILSDFCDAIAIQNEYRVFVYRGRVTGISQYRWSEFFRDVPIEEAVRIGGKILVFVEHALQGALANFTASFTVDVFVDNEEKVYLIEINKFGGDTGCGSALFHWKNDETALYATDDDKVIMRVLEKSTCPVTPVDMEL